MKFNSKPVLLACSLPLILTVFSSCSRAKYTPGPSAQAGATKDSSSSSLNGYWVEENVPSGNPQSSRGHLLKPTSIYIQDGKFFDRVKYSDGATDNFDAGITASGPADANGSWTIAGAGLVETVTYRGNQLLINDVQTYKGSTTTSQITYVKTDVNTANQHARQLWFKKQPTYAFANQFCANVPNLSAQGKSMVSQITQFATSNLASQGITLDQIRVQRNAQAAPKSPMTLCQITEDYLERGLDFARTGTTPTFPDYAKRPLLTVSVDANSDITPLLALELDDLALQSSDGGNSTVDLTPFSQIAGLEGLSLTQMKVSGLQKLNTASFKDLTLTSMDLADYNDLKKLPNLQGLSLIGNFAVEKALPVVSQLTQLDSLYLSAENIRVQKLDISPITSLPNIVNLSIYGDFFANLNFLPHFANLSSLGVTLANDDFVDMIASLSTLTSLNAVTIEKTVAKSDDLKFISRIPKITGLTLNISGGFNDLSSLTDKTCPALNNLTINGSNSEPMPTLPDLTSAMKISALSSISLSSISIPDLSIFESFLNADTTASVMLFSDEAKVEQQAEDQKLTTEFSTRYRSVISFK